MNQRYDIEYLHARTRLLPFVVFLCLGLVLSPALLAGDSALATVKAQIEALSEISGGEVGVAVEHLESRHAFSVNADESYPLASTYKVPIAAYLMSLVEAGRFSLDQMITVHPRQISPGGMPIAHFFPHDGVALSLHNLLEVMLTESSNTATDVIVELVGGGEAVTAWLRQQGIEDIRVDRTTASLIRDYLGFPHPADPNVSLRDQYEQLQGSMSAEEFEAEFESPDMYTRFVADPRDQTTPLAMNQVLGKLWRNEMLSLESGQVIREIMERCRTGANRLKGQLPPGSVVAHKTGTIGGTLNDAGVMTLPHGAGHVIISVYVKSSTLDWVPRELAIAEIARTVYDYYLTNPQARQASR